MANAAILAATTATCAECKALLASIKAKETVQTAHYIIEVTRKPAEGGLHLTAQVPAPAAQGGGGNQHVARQQQQQQQSSILEIEIPTFAVVRRPVVKRTADVLEGLKVDLQIAPINDLFNDKLDWTVSLRSPSSPLNHANLTQSSAQSFPFHFRSAPSLQTWRALR